MKKVIVSGGAGFVGSHLVKILLDRDFQVTVVDSLVNGNADYLPVHPNLKLIKEDILNTAAIREIFSEIRPDIVYHLAAIHFIPACENYPENAFRVNIEGTQSMVSACRNLDYRPKFIFTSTGAIYDPTLTTPLNEGSEIKALDIYGLSKVFAEQVLQLYAQRDNAVVTIARLFNVAGRNETNPHIIPVVLQQLKRGQTTIELGNLEPRRDYIHVEDVADALVELGVQDAPKPYLHVNIGSGVEYSVGELVAMCAAVVGTEINIHSVESRKRKFDRMSQLANVSGINAMYGWRPKRNLQQALEDVWQEYSEREIQFFE